MTSPFSLGLEDSKNSEGKVRPKTKKFVFCPNAICLKLGTEMSSNPRNPKQNPQMIIKESFDTTHNFFSKTLRNIKCFLIGHKKIPKSPVFSNKLNSKLENLYKSFSHHWESNEMDNNDEEEEKMEARISPKENIQTDEECSKRSLTVADFSGLEKLKEEKNERKYSKGFKEEPGFKDAYALAQKMKELEMMDVNDMDHVLDVEEVIHYYSRLTCPAYLDIVDKFFMNMHSDLRFPHPLRTANGSMRKFGSGRHAPPNVHGSMRSLGPIKI